MQIPAPKVASGQLIVLGTSHLAALAQIAETAALAPPFKVHQDALVLAKRAREDAELALVSPRVAARFAEYALEEVIRGIAGRAHALDGNMVSGSVFNGVCPNGLEPEVSPRGVAQKESALRLQNRLDTQPAAAKLRPEFSDKLKAATADLAAKLDARKAAGEALGRTIAGDLGARESWVAAYDANAGSIRTLFPRNRRKQDLFFDDFRTSADAADDEGTPPGGGDAPA